MQNDRENQDIVYQHFNNIAGEYTHSRTLDETPINYLAKNAPGDEHTICDLGCGTGRYLTALLKAFQSTGVGVNKAYGVDTSPVMLEAARIEMDGLKPAIDWILNPANNTGLPDQSISIVTAFNSIHHLPIKETLDEIKRILLPNGLFAIYSRVRDQESEHVWGRWFPGYIGYSRVMTRESLSSFSQYNECWQLVRVQDFTFKRKVSLSRICEQTENKHYSTLAMYSQEEFKSAYSEFLDNIKTNHPNLDAIEYPSSYSLFIYQYS
jgi:ubiquinone/menaquinone biosynthesis C-methylase UbiE